MIESLKYLSDSSSFFGTDVGTPIAFSRVRQTLVGSWHDEWVIETCSL